MVDDDIGRAQELAHQYRLPYVDLRRFRVPDGLLMKVPVELMVRHNFIPLEEMPDGRLAVAIADPSQLLMIDDIALVLGRHIVTRVSTLRQIENTLKRIEGSRRGEHD